MAEHFLQMEYEIQTDITVTERIVNRYSIFRLLSFIISFCLIAIGVADHKGGMLVAGGFAAGLFFWFVICFTRKQERLTYLQGKQEVLKAYIARFSEDWKAFPDDGRDFLSAGADYYEGALDLDLFGNASLFQYMNVAGSAKGRGRLARYLTTAFGNIPCNLVQQDIIKRQQAVGELIEQEEYSLHLETLSKCFRRRHKDLQQVSGPSMEQEDGHENKQAVLTLVFASICILLTLVSLTLAVFQIISYDWFVIMLILQLIVSQAVDGILSAHSNTAFSYMQYLAAYQPFLDAVRKQDAEADLLKELREEIGTDAAKGIKQLNTIGEALQFRHNPLVYGLLCMLCLYNMFLFVAFVRWKQRYSKRIDAWMNSVFELEALLSLAVLGRTREVSFPKLVEGVEPIITMENMRHPLIMEREVKGNDVSLVKELRLVTGSNMSGKTTYLRTLGLNLALAYAGAPVCADRAETSMMQIFTSMRVVDDVSQGISTFYAEVLRIKNMITYSKQQKPMLVLIDEIFKGTNSADRIVGATGVIKNLCHNWIIGMVSTHDFELCKLEEQEQMICNYHFDEYFEEEQLKFEYQIKEGRCTTTNALHILRMAGITD